MITASRVRDLQSEDVLVPLIGRGVRYELELLWAAWYAQRTPLNALQQMRLPLDAASGTAAAIEEAYWKALSSFREWLKQCLIRRAMKIDLIVDVPSRSQYLRPYLAACYSCWPAALRRSLVKGAPVYSGNVGTTYGALKRALRLKDKSAAMMRRVSRVLIVDDVFSTGRTAAAAISRLKSRVPAGATFTLLAPLRCGYLPPPAEVRQSQKMRATFARQFRSRLR